MNKTKTKIANAFLILLDSQSDGEPITNNDIIDKAGISKGTFYNNFNSQKEIELFIFHDIDSKVIHSITDNGMYLRNANSLDTLLRCVADTTIPAIYMQREKVRILYKSSLNGDWQKYLEAKYMRAITRFAKDIRDDDFYLHLIVKFSLDIIELWITSPIPTPPDEFRDEYYRLFNVKLNTLL